MRDDEIAHVQSTMVTMALEVRHALNLEEFITEGTVALVLGGPDAEAAARIERNAPRWVERARELRDWSDSILAGTDPLTPTQAQRLIRNSISDRLLRLKVQR